MHKRDLSPVERIHESPEKLLKTFSPPAKFFGGECPTESDIEMFDIPSHCKSKEEAAKKRSEQYNRKRKSEYILKMVKKKQLHQRPPDSLLELIVRAITSAPEGYVTFSNIYNYIADTFPFYQEKSQWWKKCIQVTLKRNRESFIHIPAPKGNHSLQNDIWTIHPLAAPRFINSQAKTDSRKESHEDLLLNEETIHGSQDESVPKKRKVAENPRETQLAVEKPTSKVSESDVTRDHLDQTDLGFVKLERSVVIDRLGTAYRNTQINNSQAISSIKTKEITNSTPKKEWRGWLDPCSRSERKLKLVQHIIEETKSMLTSSLEDDVMEHEETVASEPEMHKEQESVTKGCDQNLILSLLKAVEVLDRKKQAQEQAEAAATLKQDGSGFIGFDHDRWCGPWRGWERVFTRRRDLLRAHVSEMAGSLDLATVLAKCRQAVNLILQELEKQEIDSRREITEENEEKYLAEKIQNQIKALMKCVPNRCSEPPFSYTVLTVMALASSLDTSRTVPEIHRFLEEQFPYYGSVSDASSWKHSVELILQVNNVFVKACQGACGRKSPDHGGCWKVQAKRAQKILDRALQRESEIQKENLEYKQSKENKENNNYNITAVLNSREMKEKINTNAKEKTVKTCMADLNNGLKTDGYQKGIRRNSVIVSTFDLEKTPKRSHPENVVGIELKQMELPRKKMLTFDTNIEQLHIINESQDSFNDSETSLNKSEVDHSFTSMKSSSSSDQSVSSSHSTTDHTGSSTVSDIINMLAAEADISEGSEPSATQTEQHVAMDSEHTDCEESISSVEDPESEVSRTHSTQHSVGDDKDETVETGRTSVVTSSHRETSPEDEEVPPGPPEASVTENRDVLFCQMCYKLFSCSFLFAHHSCFRCRYNSFVCYICHVVFSSSCRLSDHLSSLHPGAHNLHLVSTLCLSNRVEPDRAVADRATAENHYKCTACLAVFSSKHMLDSHKEIFHSNIFTLECNLCRPAKLFRNKEDFRLHLVARHPNNG